MDSSEKRPVGNTLIASKKMSWNAGNALSTEHSYFYHHQFTISCWISVSQNIYVSLTVYFSNSH